MHALPILGPLSCTSVELVEQTSRAKCIPGLRFGCVADDAFFVQNCRGRFRCDSGPTVACGFPPGAPLYSCFCNGSGAASLLPNATRTFYPSFPSQVDALVASLPLPLRPCIWDDSEFMIKVSVYSDERPLIMGWVLAWLRSIKAAGTCAPRLHVISDLPEETSAWRGLFRAVPNVSHHTLSYPFEMDAFYSIQWPMLWLDNFTAAPYVLILDTDSPPLLPLRCHQLFDRFERPIWYSWPNGPRTTRYQSVRWAGVSDAIVRGVLAHQRHQRADLEGMPYGAAAWAWPAGLGGHVELGSLANVSWLANRALWTRQPLGTGPFAQFDLMTFFPVVVPRALLAPTRDIVRAACRLGLLDGSPAGVCPDCAAQNPRLRSGRSLRLAGGCGNFDAAWLAIERPSYADLMGKLSLALPPYADAAIRWKRCLRTHSDPPLAAASGRPDACRHYAQVAPHLKYPAERSGISGRLLRHEAAMYGLQLAKAASHFVRGHGPLPPEMLPYANLSRGDARLLRRRLLQPDESGRVCGRRPSGIRAPRFS